MNRTVTTLNAILVMSVAAVGFGKDIYKNDFSSRSSNKDMPGNRWFSSAYAYPASLAYGYWAGGLSFTPSSPYEESPSSVQDGWAFTQGPVDSNGISWSFNRRYVEFWTRTQDDSNNPFACFSATDGTNVKNHRVHAIQPIYNAFSTGSIRLSIDFRVPTRYYTAYDGAYLRMRLLCANAMSPSNRVTGTSPLAIGFHEDGKDLRPLDRWGYSGNSDLPTSGAYDRTHWYRHVADISLDSSTYSCRVYDMGTTQPSLTTPTPSTVFGTAKGSTTVVTKESGPVCGLGFEMMRATRYSRDAENALVLEDCPCIDNVRVWWRQSGMDFSDEDLCYENDFKIRRVRTLATGGKSAEYATALSETTTDTYTYWDYVSKSAENVATAVNLVKGHTTGRDGWKPKSYTPNSYRVVYTSEDGGNVLAAIRDPNVNEDHYAKITHQLGQTISSGKVKFEYDFRTPSSWVNYYNSHNLTLRLGDDTQCGVSASDGNSLINTGFGGDSGYKASAIYPYWGTAIDTSTTLANSTWYRARVVADLSTSTYDYELYSLGSVSGPLDRSVPGDPVFTKTGAPFSSTSSAKTITSIAIHGYDIGKTYAGAFLVDNIRLWKGTDGTVWDIVFQTDFNKRVFYGRTAVQRGMLLDADVNRVGLDAWVRRGTGSADMYLMKTADNPFVVIDGEGTGAEAVHTLGKTVRKGKITVRSDIRPPRRMTTKAPYPAAIYAGGDEYAQGETCTSSARRHFRDAAFGAFGFARAGSAGDLNYYSQVKPFVKGASGEELGNAISGDGLASWYRFVATFDLDAKTWRVDVYNQGTIQPTADSADGTLVKSFEGLTFVNDDPSGFSAIGIAGGGTTGDKPLEVDKRSVLFDNLKVEGDDFGLMLLLK